MNFRTKRNSFERALLVAGITLGASLSMATNRAHAATYNWQGNSLTGDWNTVGATSWDGGPPNAAGDVVQRMTAITADVDITQSVNDVTIGGVRVGNGSDLGNHYFEIDFGAGRVLNFDNNGSGATIVWDNPNISTNCQLWFGGAGSINLQDNLTIHVNSTANNPTPGGTVAFDVPISGSKNITINSAQPIPNYGAPVAGQVNTGVAFRKASTYVGTTTIERGAAQFIAGTAFGDGANTVNLGVAGSDSAAIQAGGTTATLTYPIVVASGNTGTLTIANQSSSTSAVITYSGSITLGSNLNIISRSSAENHIFSGNLSGPGGVILPSIDNNGQTSFRGTNSYTGDTTINGQSLVVRGGSAIPNGPGTGILTVNGTLRLGSSGETINGLNGTGIVNVVSTPRTLTLGDNDANGAFSGTVTTGISITKIGNGTQTLSGANSYTGTTIVNQGTLLVNGTHTGGGAYTVDNGATLGGANGNIGSNAAVSSGGILAPGDAGVGSLTIASAQVGGQLSIEYDGAAHSVDLLTVSGALDISGAAVSFQNLSPTNLAGGPYVFATYASLSSNPFSSVSGLPSGYAIDYNYLGLNQIALVAALHAGDFDGDGDVDGADFVAWQTNFPTPSGATLAQGDADGDGDVDGADFVVWQTNFPFTPGPGAAPVPEPSAIILAAIAPLGIAMSRCVKRKGRR
jgi:autotransporter-associated beta strand protein